MFRKTIQMSSSIIRPRKVLSAGLANTTQVRDVIFFGPIIMFCSVVFIEFFFGGKLSLAVFGTRHAQSIRVVRFPMLAVVLLYVSFGYTFYKTALRGDCWTNTYEKLPDLS